MSLGGSNVRRAPHVEGDPAELLDFLRCVVQNNEQSGLGVADAFGATAWQTGGGAPVAGLPLQQAFASLFDFTQTVFHDAALPSALNLSEFQTAAAGLAFCTNPGCGVGSGYSAIQGEIDSLAFSPAPTPAPIPEPASLALLGLGCCAALVAARKPTR